MDYITLTNALLSPLGLLTMAFVFCMGGLCGCYMSGNKMSKPCKPKTCKKLQEMAADEAARRCW